VTTSERQTAIREEHRMFTGVASNRITRLAACIAAIMAVAAPAMAQVDQWSFRDLPYYEPLKADPRAARITLIVPAWSKEFPHSVEPGSRFVWQITLGRELPIIGWRSESVDGRVGNKQWGVGLWIPVSFHMIEDHKDESAPIVDTDYRFGFMTKFQYGLTENSWLGVRLTPWAHESTHLGDEYVILAQRRPDFERTNPSFEYLEYGISYERSFGRSMVTLRHGGITLHGDDGYYSDHALGSDEPTLTPSERNFEPSFGLEWRGWKRGERDVFVSLDARHKLVYNFHRPQGQDESKQWSYSLAVGRAVDEGTRGVPLRDYFGYFYWGVNPFGQLREQQDYWLVGVGWTFGT
jgi:hypothetical protein